MKPSKRKVALHALRRAPLLAAAAFGIGAAVPAATQEDSGLQKTAVLEEVIVTARRREESVQDVPISISVFDQEQLDRQNILHGSDLAVYTPSLVSNDRFGPEQNNFSIRGFTQALGTTPSVGVYFADVVAPRGGGAITAGDGAGPGHFFDLQNVQVLKGPQGTLFGKNTTGGAILLVPQKPTDVVEGYLELGAGDFDMRRGQGVINVPISERLRARFGLDYQKRDGHLKNRGLGPDRLGDMEYTAGRASLVVDVTDAIENYAIFTITNSENNGIVSGLFACNPSVALGSFCVQQLEHQGDDFFTLESGHPDPESKLDQWQFINTTTWNVSETLTVKNILSYSDLEQISRGSVFGTNFPLPTIPGAGPAFSGGQTFSLTQVDQQPGVPTTSTNSFVEEFQLQGLALDNRLTWQAGLYYEKTEPGETWGAQSANLLFCTEQPGEVPSTFNCQDFFRVFTGMPIGNVQRQRAEIDFTNRAVYSQATYDITEAFRVTAGLRYTWDKSEGEAAQIVYNEFPFLMAGPPGNTRCVITFATLANGCKTDLSQESEAPTGLLGLDYLPAEDVMLYAKYSRGYRQGSLTPFGPQGFRSYDEEKVDAYEVGAKTKFGGPVPGTFNIAVFYNELKDQQIQTGFISSTNQASPTSGILNAGKSRIQGVELETSLALLESLRLHIAYTYLDTELVELEGTTAPPGSVYDVFIPTSKEGEDAPFAPDNSLTASLTYLLPVPRNIGDVSAGVTYVYTDELIASARGPFGTLDDYELLNANLSWRAIFGSAFDASAFVTNALDEEYRTFVSGGFDTLGAEFGNVGQPRIWGVRLRYSFGQ